MGSTTVDDAVRDKFRAIYGAIQRGNANELEEHLAHDIEWVLPDSVPWGGTRHGHLGVAAMKDVYDDHVDGLWADPDDVIGDGDVFVVVGRLSGRARDSGREFEVPFAHLWRMTDGVPAFFRGYYDAVPINEALAASTE